MKPLLASVTRWVRHTVADHAVRLPAPRPLLGPHASVDPAAGQVPAQASGRSADRAPDLAFGPTPAPPPRTFGTAQSATPPHRAPRTRATDSRPVEGRTADSHAGDSGAGDSHATDRRAGEGHAIAGRARRAERVR